MCVIYYCQNDIPSEKELINGEECNSHGGGLAWIESKKGESRVYWKKNLKVDEIQRLIKDKKIQTPFFIHFRIASVGGVDPRLCHPFPISEKAELDLSGSNTTGVLFHNGTWGGWQSDMKDCVVKSSGKIRIPDRGPWSDSRAMAWLGGHYGINVLPLFSGISQQRIGVLEPDGAWVLGEWIREDKKQGWYQSSPTWDRKRAVCTTPTLVTGSRSSSSPQVVGSAGSRGSISVFTMEELDVVAEQLRKQGVRFARGASAL